MARIYKVLDDSGNDLLPVADATLMTGENMNTGTFETGTLTVQFFDANEEPVTPTGGTVVPEMSATPDGQWFAPGSGDTTINAIDAGINAGYTIPVFNGPAYKGRITLSGITGAVYCKASFWRA